MAIAIRLRAGLRALVASPRSTLDATRDLSFNSSKYHLPHTFRKRYKSYQVSTSGHPRMTAPILSHQPSSATIRPISPKYSSPETLIKNRLENEKHEKWGWVIYRTDYTDDLAWSKFKDLLSRHTANIVGKSDAPEILNKVEWTYMDDGATYDQASRPFLRQHFNQWAKAAVVDENPRAKGHQLDVWSNIRYHVFIQVNGECLQSITAGVDETWDIDIGLTGRVHIIDPNWTPTGYDTQPYGLEEIDGCKEENVGWMAIRADHLSPEFYTTISSLMGIWYVFYVRPPGVMSW